MESEEDEQVTGLGFPKTWRGAYVIVLAFFLTYVGFLLALGEHFQ